MMKWIIAAVLLVLRSEGHAARFSDSSSELSRSAANSTVASSAHFTLDVNDTTSDLNAGLSNVVSDTTISANNNDETVSLLDAHNLNNHTIVKVAVKAAQSALDNVAASAVNNLTRVSMDPSSSPSSISDVVSTAEATAINAISGASHAATSLSSAIRDAVHSAVSSSNFLRNIVNIVTRLTAVFTTFIGNATSQGIIAALQDSFASSLKILNASLKSINN